MSHRLSRLAALIALLCLPVATTSTAVVANDAPLISATVDDPTYLSFGAGYFDVLDDSEAVEFRAEYRSGALFWIFKPFAGVMATSEASFYGYGGVFSDFHVGRRWVFSPSIAAGLYEDGDGKDLGHTVEFRSAIEAAYQFDNRSRLGILFYHISNAGLGDHNSGTEVLGLSYSLPID